MGWFSRSSISEDKQSQVDNILSNLSARERAELLVELEAGMKRSVQEQAERDYQTGRINYTNATTIAGGRVHTPGSSELAAMGLTENYTGPVHTEAGLTYYFEGVPMSQEAYTQALYDNCGY